MFTRIADSWEPRFSEAALRQFGRDKERFTDALKKNKQDVINWDNVLMGWEQLYEEAGDEWRSTFVPLMKGVIETQAEQQSIAFGMQFDVRNLYAEAWFDNYTMDFSSGVMDTTGLTLNQLLQDAQREGWSIPETEDHLGLVFAQWMHGNLVPDNFEWFSQRMPAYRRSLIARTEIIRSSNAGIQELYRQWGVEQKEWLATEDDSTCVWCREMNGKIIPIGGTFWEQGQSMTMQVGQVVQSMTFNYEAVRFPPLHVSCRCCLLPWRPEWAELGVQRPIGITEPMGIWGKPIEFYEPAVSPVLPWRELTGDERQILLNNLDRLHDDIKAMWRGDNILVETTDEFRMAEYAGGHIRISKDLLHSRVAQHEFIHDVTSQDYMMSRYNEYDPPFLFLHAKGETIRLQELRHWTQQYNENLTMLLTSYNRDINKWAQAIEGIEPEITLEKAMAQVLEASRFLKLVGALP